MHSLEWERQNQNGVAGVTFNLITEKWIPILWANGKADRVGIRTALAEAGRIRQIASSNPMDNVSLLRFLLAVLLWCRPYLNEEDRQGLDGNARGVPEEWLAKLREHEAAFNLLGDGSRFMQAPATPSNKRPVADLFHELPGDSNKAHFRHIRDYKDGACPRCIAIGLVRLPVAITGKGSGKYPGINGDPPMYFVPVGNTLRESFILNWPSVHDRGDQPCWFGGQHPEQDQVGLMEGFTWTSRQFRISSDGVRQGTCMVCGDTTDHLVVRLKELNLPNGRAGLSRCNTSRWRDPHIIYNDKNKPWQAEDAEKNLPKSAGQWREWLSGLFVCDTSGLQCPQAVTFAVNHRNGLVSVLVAGFAMQSLDKTVESSSCCVKVPRGDCDAVAGLKLLDKAVSTLLDPEVTLKEKKLARFKNKHWLRLIRHGDRPLSDSVRAALADRLPALEPAMFERVCTDGGIAPETPQAIASATDWQSLIVDVVNAATPGSSLRRREAMARARSALNAAISKATQPPKPKTNKVAKTKPSPDAAKPKRTRKKKGTST